MGNHRILLRLFFTVEICFKLLGFGWLFWTDGWNLIDFVIVAISLVEVAMMWFVGQSSSGLSSFRMLRIFRIVRVIGFVARLNLLVQAFLIAMKSVIWVGVLLLMCVYIASIMAQSFFNNVMPDRFGTVLRSMASLFQILTMDGWASTMAWPIGEEHPYSWAFFVGFVLLGSFGLLNLLTGVFIEALMEITRANDIDKAKALAKQRANLITLIASAFKETDEDCGGTLDQDELPELLSMCNDYQDALDFVGLSYSKMERACLVADYDHEERTYWRKIDPNTGEDMVTVHHNRYRPPPEENTPNYYLLEEGGDEGVMEGELVEALTKMDDSTTVADYYAIMKKIRLLEKSTDQSLTAIEEESDRLKEGVKELFRLSGNADWEPPTKPREKSEEPELMPSQAEIMPGCAQFKPMFRAQPADSVQVNPIFIDEQPTIKTSVHPAQPAQPVANPEMKNHGQLEKIAQAMFDRYDLDGSGTINSIVELRQLVTNLLYHVGAMPETTRAVTEKLALVEDNISWKLPELLQWLDEAGLHAADVEK